MPKPTAPHWRVSMTGVLTGTPEIFSMSFALGKAEWTGFLQDFMGPNDTYWDDLAADCVAYFGHTDLAISSYAVLKLVKVAPIGSDGLYAGPSVEREVSQAGTGGAAYQHPLQTALKVTLHTDSHRSLVKGGWYLPAVNLNVGTDGLISTAAIDLVESRTQTFLDNVNNAPGLDVLNLSAVVASGTRIKQPAGPPKLYQVNGVSVGRRFDVIRRRANKRTEARGAALPVADPGE